jgi:hypothetical protein
MKKEQLHEIGGYVGQLHGINARANLREGERNQ